MTMPVANTSTGSLTLTTNANIGNVGPSYAEIRGHLKDRRYVLLHGG